MLLIHLQILFGQVTTAQGSASVYIRAAEQPGHSNEAQIKNCWQLACKMKTANLQGYLYDREFVFFFSINFQKDSFLVHDLIFHFCLPGKPQRSGSKTLQTAPPRICFSILQKRKQSCNQIPKNKTFFLIDQVQQNWPSKGGSRQELRRAYGE